MHHNFPTVLYQLHQLYQNCTTEKSSQASNLVQNIENNSPKVKSRKLGACCLNSSKRKETKIVDYLLSANSAQITTSKKLYRSNLRTLVENNSAKTTGRKYNAENSSKSNPLKIHQRKTRRKNKKISGKDGADFVILPCYEVLNHYEVLSTFMQYGNLHWCQLRKQSFWQK